MEDYRCNFPDAVKEAQLPDGSTARAAATSLFRGLRHFSDRLLNDQPVSSLPPQHDKIAPPLFRSATSSANSDSPANRNRTPYRNTTADRFFISPTVIPKLSRKSDFAKDYWGKTEDITSIKQIDATNLTVNGRELALDTAMEILKEFGWTDASRSRLEHEQQQLK